MPKLTVTQSDRNKGKALPDGYYNAIFKGSYEKLGKVKTPKEGEEPKPPSMNIWAKINVQDSEGEWRQLFDVWVGNPDWIAKTELLQRALLGEGPARDGDPDYEVNTDIWKPETKLIVKLKRIPGMNGNNMVNEVVEFLPEGYDISAAQEVPFL